MKTKLTLSIIGVLNIIQSILYTLFAIPAVDMMFNVGEEAANVAVLFQYALSPAFLMIGLIFIFSRNFEVNNAKKLLLALIIAYIPLFFSFYTLASSPLTNIGLPDFAVDILVYGLALFTYLKPKQ